MPWEYQILETLRDTAIWGILIVAVIVGVRSGRRRKLPDDLGRKVESFGGTLSEANGPLPTFLILLYIGVAIFWIFYTVNVVINGYRY